MKKRISRTRHLFLTKNFILMLVMLVIIIMATSAWFTVYKTVDATHITVKAISTEIDIAESVKTYSNDYSQVLTDGPGVFGSTVEFSDITFNKDCTGDGETLIVPEFNVTKDYDSVRINGGKEVNTNLTPEYAKSSEFSRIEKLKHPDQDAPEYQFAQLEFYVRSKNPQLYLEPSSVLISKTESSNHALSEPLSAGDPKRSAYGAFNVDGIVGAMRVSLIGEACTSVNQVWSSGQLTSTDTSRGDPVKQLLWVPRPDVHLNVTETAGDISTWTMATGVTSSQYNGVTYHHSYYRPTSGGVELVANDTDPKTKVSMGNSVFADIGLKKSSDDEDFIPEYYGAAIAYSSSDTSVASVNKDGLITPVAQGNATITTRITGKYGDYKEITTSVEIPQNINQVPVITNVKIPAAADGSLGRVEIDWYALNKSASATMTTGTLFYTI